MTVDDAKTFTRMRSRLVAAGGGGRGAGGALRCASGSCFSSLACVFGRDACEERNSWNSTWIGVSDDVNLCNETYCDFLYSFDFYVFYFFIFSFHGWQGYDRSYDTVVPRNRHILYLVSCPH